jgi:DNA polymerase (family 10)
MSRAPLYPAMSVNVEVARVLYEIGELHALRGDVFRSRAYLRAAQRVESLTPDVREVHDREALAAIPGVGKGIAAVIAEYLTTGTVRQLTELRADLPTGLVALLEVEGIGPKTARGFGPKSEANLLRAIAAHRGMPRRILLGHILPVVLEIEGYLTECDAVERVEAAGSARRRRETVGDLDVLVASGQGAAVVAHFTAMPGVSRVVSRGTTRSTVVLRSALQVDLRVIPPHSYGAALQYFTGSKAHNVKLRTLAVKQGYKLNEYGLFRRDDDDDVPVASDDEAAIYARLGLDPIPPELREDRGEIEAAATGSLPELVRREQLRGDLHVHSDWSDGAASLAAIAQEAARLGLAYVAICDHAQSLGVARGLDEDRLRAQMTAIDRLNRDAKAVTLLKGVEANVLADGRLDLPRAVLRDLDVVVASLHSGFKASRKALTARVVTAIHHDAVTAIGHPTGRLIQRRAAYPLDLDAVFEAAAQQRVMLEINAHPERLDLNDVHSRAAQAHGVTLCIGTDAHAIDQLRYLDLDATALLRAAAR